MSEAIKKSAPHAATKGKAAPAGSRTAAKKKPSHVPAKKAAVTQSATSRNPAAKKTSTARKPAASKKPTVAKKYSATKKPVTANKPTVTKKSSAAKKPTVAKKPTTAKRSTAKKKATSARRPAQAKKRTTSVKRVAENPVALEANRRHAGTPEKTGGDLFMEKRPKSKKNRKGGGKPPRKLTALFSALDVALIAAIALLVAFGIRQQAAYAEFRRMREVVDQQTFYEGTTIEGVDVSNMTLSVAMEYWRDRVEARNEGRTVTFDDGTSVTAKELGYASDYESVLSAAWSAGRSGSLEERYRLASHRVDNPVAYRITRRDYSPKVLDAYVQGLAEQIDRPATEATIASFDTQTYEFQFNPSQPGAALDQDAVKASIVEAIEGGGGSVALPVEVIQPETTTQDVASQYGLIDYAITNASSSSRSRINNIVTAMSYINGTRVAPGETFSFNQTVGQRTRERGFKMAPAYSSGEVTEQIGGGICQVSTTLFNAAVKADMEIVERHNHSLTVHYVDKGKDATVDWGNQDFRFKNTSSDDIYICCYLTDDKRVRFGIFGKLLPNGEKITLEANTTEVVKAETEYQKSVFLGPGQTYVLQEGRNGYKAEAWKVRWDAAGNEISRELLCKSVYKVKNEIIQYGT